MIDQDISANVAITPFDSLVHLKDRHEQLLSDFEGAEQSPTKQSGEIIRSFLQRVIKTGAHISGQTNRALAQNIVDFWNGYLLRHDLESWESRPRLLPFGDSELTIEKEVSCPYVGLDPFSRINRDIFFGRGGLLADLLEDLRQGHNIILSGPSGCGKSSLLTAGLQLDLERQSWQIIGPIAPGRDPKSALQEIERFLNQSPPIAQSAKSKQVLLLDQFEEVFTVCADPSERDNLGRALKELIEKETIPLVVAIRSDYEEKVLKLRSFSWLSSAKHESVPGLDSEALRQSILEPAHRVHLDFDEEVCNQLVLKTLNQVSGLPLLQFALVELWDHREKQSWTAEGQGRISLECYNSLGGTPSEILNQAADREYDALPNEEERRAAKDIFLELVQLGDTLEITSRPQPTAELMKLEDPQRVNSVVHKLLAARLLRKRSVGTGNQDWVEITHEALIRNWGRLRTWVSEDRENTVVRLRLRKRVQEWTHSGRSRAELLTPAELAQYSQLERLRPSEIELVQVSQSSLKRKKALKDGLAAAAVLALAVWIWRLGSLYVWEKKLNAEQQRYSEIHRQVEEANRLLKEQRPVARISEGDFQPLANEYWQDNVQTYRQSLQKLLTRTGIAKIALICKDDLQKEQVFTEGAAVLISIGNQPVLVTPKSNLRPSPETVIQLSRSTSSKPVASAGGSSEPPSMPQYCVVGQDVGAQLVVEFVRPDNSVVRFYTNAVRDLQLSASSAQSAYLENFRRLMSVIVLPDSGNVRTKGPDGEPRKTHKRLSLTEIKPFELPSSRPIVSDGTDRPLVVLAGFVSFVRGSNDELADRARTLFPNPSGIIGKNPNYPADQFWLRFGTLMGTLPDNLGFFIHDCVATETDVGAPVFDLKTGSLLGIDFLGTPVLGNIPVHQPAFGLWQLHQIPVKVVAPPTLDTGAPAGEPWPAQSISPANGK